MSKIENTRDKIDDSKRILVMSDRYINLDMS